MTASGVAKSSALDPQLARIEYARGIIGQEQEVLSQLVNSLGDSFSAAVDAVLTIPASGRLVVAGIGKTGFIGMKLSATFASIGVPSFFLHPSEAMHGDLGRVTTHDVLLVLSTSGESAEITAILPFARRLGCRVLALTASENSSLARQADIVIAVGKIAEAGPLGLAPTSSALALLAMGDALAMTVLHERPIDRRTFATSHPGGALGRSLLLVSEIMRKNDEHCVMRDSATCAEVLHAVTCTKGRPGAASIVDATGRLVGIFTDGNLRRCLDAHKDFLSRPVEEFMGANPKTVPGDVLAEEALSVMTQYKIDQVIVVNQKHQPVGMVDIQDLV